MAAHNGVSLSWGGFDAALGQAAKKLGNTQALMESVGEALVSGTLKRFDAEEDPQGNQWEPSGRASEEGGTITPKNAKKLVFTGRGGKKVAVDKVTIPARPYLGVSEEDLDDVKAAMTDFLAGAFKP